MSKDIITGVLIIIFIHAVAVQIPVVGTFSALLLPLPIFFFRIKIGRGGGAAILLLSGSLMIGISGGLSMDSVFFITLLFLGFFLSEFAEKHLSVEKILFYSSLAILGILTCILAIYSAFHQIQILELISQYVIVNLNLTIAFYKQMGASQEALMQLTDSLEQIQYVLVRITPSLAVVSTLFVAWANLLMVRPFLRSQKLFYLGLEPLNRWKAPEPMVWGVIACGVLMLFPETGIKMIGLNGLIFFMIVYFFQGIAIISFFFEKKRFPRILRIGIYSFVAIQQLFCLVIIALGFFDTWFNFRKPDTQIQHEQR
jgi:uncharacterized protein YybS (DUF2232 family)